MALERVGGTKGGRHYCGPSAISAVTGVNVEVIEDLVARLRNADPYRNRRVTAKGIKAMGAGEVREVVRTLGFQLIIHDVAYRTTFAKWLRERGELRRAKCIVLVTGHFIAAHGMDVYCSAQGKTTEAKTRYKKSRVQRVYEIR